jgi:hypothetical protein
MCYYDNCQTISVPTQFNINGLAVTNLTVIWLSMHALLSIIDPHNPKILILLLQYYYTYMYMLCKLAFEQLNIYFFDGPGVNLTPVIPLIC